MREPASIHEIAEILGDASREKRLVSIRGAGTKAGWGAPSAPADIELSTVRLNAIVAHRHGDLTATIQAGATLADVNRALAAHKQWLPLDPPFADRATIGGIVATNDSGPRRHRYGAPRDLIIGAEFVRGDGVVAKAGGIVVKNVAGYDVSRLLTGSFGSLAVIVSATFKLYPLPQASRTVVADCATRPVLLKGAPCEYLTTLVSLLAASQLTPTAVELQVPPGRVLIRFETIDAAAGEQASVAARLATEAGMQATVVQSDEESVLWDDHARRPWSGEGAILKVTLLPADLSVALGVLAGCGVEHEIVGRAGVGVLLVRVAGDETAQARIVTDLRARIGEGRGSVIVVRGSDRLNGAVDVWGPMGDALPVMHAIKRNFDPAGVLNPGRGPGGL